MDDKLRLDRYEYMFVCLSVCVFGSRLTTKNRAKRKKSGRTKKKMVSQRMDLPLGCSRICCRLLGSVDLFGLMSLKHSNSFLNLDEEEQ